VQPEQAAALREVPVVADVDADRRVARLEHGITEVAGLEVELLPERGQAMGDVVLAVFTHVASVRVEDGGRVVVHALGLFLVDRDHHHHRVFLRDLLHEADGRAVGHLFRELVPAGILLRREVGAVEQLLQAEDLDAASGGLVDEADVFGDHRLAHVGQAGLVRREDVAGLDEAAADDAWHGDD
jgi:hypothetical protein